MSVPSVASVGAADEPVLYHAETADLDCEVADDVLVAFEGRICVVVCCDLFIIADSLSVLAAGCCCAVEEPPSCDGGVEVCVVYN